MEIQTDRDGNPILDQLGEEGFIDLTFRISDMNRRGSMYRFNLSASFHNRAVGMSVAVVKGIQGGFNAKMDLVKSHVYREGVRFERSGVESDRLVSAIAELYGVTAKKARMVESETFTAIALHQGKLDMETEPVKLKIFGKDGEPFVEEDYYESFFNVDFADGMVYWNEKDSDYREPLLRALMGK